MTARVLPLPAALPATTLPPDKIAKTVKAAHDFEAMALGQLLEPMFNTVDTAHGLFGGGEGEEAFKPMLVSEMAKQIAAHGGLGLARPILEQMLRAQEARTAAPTLGASPPAQGSAAPRPTKVAP